MLQIPILVGLRTDIYRVVRSRGAWEGVRATRRETSYLFRKKGHKPRGRDDPERQRGTPGRNKDLVRLQTQRETTRPDAL